MPQYIGRLKYKDGSKKHADSEPCNADNPEEASKMLAQALPGFVKIMLASGFIELEVLDYDPDADDDDEEEEEEDKVTEPDDEEEGGAFPA